MKSEQFNLMRYDADDGKVFDWAEPRFQDVIDEDGKPTGEKEQEHLYVSTLFIGSTDDINNYIEVEKPNEIHN